MFDRFEEFDIATTDTSIHGCRGGDGPPLLLLHGIPETHLMWHRVALRLAERYTVVATDLRGYGDSGKPPGTADHEPYSMRAIGRDQLKVMQHLGYGRFGVVGHDRGACCAYRLALDHPNAVLRLAVMDVVPVGDAYNRADKDFSLLYRQWSFLAAPEPAPEQFINAAPANLVDFMLDTWSEVTSAFPAEVRGNTSINSAIPIRCTPSARSSAHPQPGTTSRTRRIAGSGGSPALCSFSGVSAARSANSMVTARDLAGVGR
ncbi:alpha/beta fold hydrolase [Streptomyces sp. NPDC001222]|uniref:alpha/beta fold hydrolase n=1 Tax=Streptomyces sp. NPDC001222 TaxID=3364548 RepID=UPI0036ADEC7B